MNFEEDERQTKITMQMLFSTTEAKNNAAEFGAVEGGRQTLARLNEFLKSQID